MRILLDACVWGGALASLAERGHDVVWAGAFGPGIPDAEILRRALHERRVVVTIDKDFGELAIVHGLPHAGIVRLVGFAAREQAAVCAQVLESYAADLARGVIITVDRGRVRIREPAANQDGEPHLT